MRGRTELYAKIQGGEGEGEKPRGVARTSS